MNKNIKALTLSIVIPVYNEQGYIKECLESIKNQTIMPNEVILVDNNCTDKTIEIAKQFKFVRVVKEFKQGIVFARNKGLSSAKGDIIGRIDADARLTPNWVSVVLRSFLDDDLAAITGPGVTSTSPVIKGKQLFPSLRTAFWSKTYLFVSTGIMRVTVLWGANMAIRKTSWELLKDKVCNDEKLVHEDQDLSLLLAGFGMKARIIQGLDIKTDGTTYFFWPKYKEYIIRSFNTLNYHKKIGTLDSSLAIKKSLWLKVLAIILGLIPAMIFSICSFLFFTIPNLILRIIKSFKINK